MWVRTQPQHDSSGPHNEAFRILIRPSKSGNPLTEEAVAAVEVIGRFLLFQLNFKSILTPQRGEKWSLCAGLGGRGGGRGHHSCTLCRRFQLHHLEPLTRLQTGCTELDRDWRMENYISPPAALPSNESHFSPAMSKTWLPCTFIRP